MKARRRQLAVALGLTIAVLAGSTPARAATADDKRAEAKRIAAERERLITEAERLNERSLAAQAELDVLARTLSTTNAHLAVQTTALADLSAKVEAFAVKTYVFGTSSADVSALVDPNAAQDVVLRRGYAPAVLGTSSDITDQYRAAQADIVASQQTVVRQTEQQRRLGDEIAGQRRAIADRQQQLTALASSVDGELATLVADEQARQAAAADAAAADKQRAAAVRETARLAAQTARAVVSTPANRAPATTTGPQPTAAPRPSGTTKGTTKGSGTPSAPTSSAPTSRPLPPVPPPPAYPAPSPAAAIAVAEAMRQLGKPYVFATNGPNTFDCSGLTQWAWAKAGVAMEHYTVSQYNAFPRVPLDALQPGDLVFFNVDLGHMGMYIGGGQIIQSPRTGDVVKISPLNGRNLVGAVRPG